MKRSPTVLLAGAALIAVVAGLAVVADSDWLLHRLSRSETLNGARLDPPSILSRPRTSYSNVLSHCGFCGQWAAPDFQNRTVQLGWLVSDEALAGWGYSNVSNRPTTSAEVPLPRLVWVVQWPSRRCFGREPLLPEGTSPPPPMTSCTWYDVIDDATGLELDTGQA